MSDPGTAAAKADGQVFYGAYRDKHPYAFEPWDNLADENKAAIEAGAEAVAAPLRAELAAVRAACDLAQDDYNTLARERDKLRARIGELERLAAEILATRNTVVSDEQWGIWRERAAAAGEHSQRRGDLAAEWDKRAIAARGHAETAERSLAEGLGATADTLQFCAFSLRRLDGTGAPSAGEETPKASQSVSGAVPQPAFSHRAYGVELDWLGDDGNIVARGHVPDLRFIAAANHLARTDAGLANLYDDFSITLDEALTDIRCTWALPADPARYGTDWAIRHDSQVTEQTPGAFPVTVLMA